MRSLKAAMSWDEDVFGREYDLDVFQIVAVRDFNFGAMENKGLNIFNSAYVLADGKTATDADFEAIESIVAHEYFHNWTGNRITCRDWFQLCLKEGLTVYRDQEFTKAMRSPAVARIKEVIRLRTRQFPEDAGPLAHSVRPDAYARIDNLYTATVYEKGAELIRMLRLMVGDEAFFAGMNRYFDTHDGTAATIEDFISSLPALDRPGPDGAFAQWYAQAGHAGRARQGRLRRSRAHLAPDADPDRSQPTPGQPIKSPLAHSRARRACSTPTARRWKRVWATARACRARRPARQGEHRAIHLQRCRLAPRASLEPRLLGPDPLWRTICTEGERASLAGLDDDAFAQWEALQTIARALILDAVRGGAREPDQERLNGLCAGAAALGGARHAERSGLTPPSCSTCRRWAN